ncbi:MAG: hypothetical protein ABI703_07160 [Gemmatimonadales bacterium]
MTQPPAAWLRGPIAGIQPLLQPAHLPGSLDRLLTYSRAEALNSEQLAALAAERVHEDRPELTRSLARPREVGRKRLPSTTLGLIFHAAEHSARHAGQIVTLARVVHG